MLRALEKCSFLTQGSTGILVNECNRFHDNVGCDARVKLVVRKPTNRLGRKEPNDDYYRSRFPPRVSANSFGGYRDRRVPGKAASASRGRGNVLPCAGGPEGAGWDGSQRACTLVRTTGGRVAV